MDGPLAILALSVAGLAGFALAFLVGRDAAIARRVFARFLLNIALPLGAMLAALVWGLALAFDFEVGVWQAIIAGLVIAAGWLTTAIFAEIGRTQDKAERLRDYHKAIYAEIGTTVQALWNAGTSEADGRNILDRMAHEPDFVPFIPREVHDTIFSSLIDRIDVLPRQTIDAIVAYYAQIRAVSGLAEDMRADAFRTLSQDRRMAVYADFLELRKVGYAFGLHALKLIAAYAEGGPAAAEAVAGQKRQ
jgi:hypothetical protein